MRWLTILPLLCIAAPAAAQDNDAEKLYRAMEKKIRAAKTLRIVFEAEYAADAPAQKMTGVLHHAMGNKGRLELDSDFGLKLLLVSDGKVLHSTTPDDTKGTIDKNPPHLKDADRSTPALVARVGIATGFFIPTKLVPANHPSEKSATFDVDKVLRAHHFKLGLKAAVDKREIQVVIFTLESKYANEPMQASVWIDTQSLLPVKRVLMVEQGPDAWRIAESYTEFTIDGKVDPKLFDIEPFEIREKAGQELFRAMEKKIRSAKSLHLEFEADFAGDGRQVVMKGTVYHAVGNKGRMEIETNLIDKQDQWLFVSDGKSLYSKVDGIVKIDSKPAGLNDVDRSTPGLIARVGVVGGMFIAASDPVAQAAEKKQPFDIDKTALVKNFWLGMKLKVDQREVQVVEYQIVLQSGKEPLKASVWIDTQTQMPLKRTLTGKVLGGEMSITETYSAFTVDGKLDPKLFEIPK
jgi:outer membrane lipoprotein-sorting protein